MAFAKLRKLISFLLTQSTIETYTDFEQSALFLATMNNNTLLIISAYQIVLINIKRQFNE